jgi:hypothetical protein
MVATLSLAMTTLGRCHGNKQGSRLIAGFLVLLFLQPYLPQPLIQIFPCGDIGINFRVFGINS